MIKHGRRWFGEREMDVIWKGRQVESKLVMGDWCLGDGPARMDGRRGTATGCHSAQLHQGTPSSSRHHMLILCHQGNGSPLLTIHRSACDTVGAVCSARQLSLPAASKQQHLLLPPSARCHLNAVTNCYAVTTGCIGQQVLPITLLTCDHKRRLYTSTSNYFYKLISSYTIAS